MPLLTHDNVEQEELPAFSLFGEKTHPSHDEGKPASIKKKVDFNFYSISNAIARRDRKAAWIAYQRALRRGASAEDVFWRGIWWQVRTLAAARTSDEGLRSLAAKLVELYHETRRGLADFALGLELALLNL